MSIFDPDTFLDEEQEELSTERVLVPIGVHAAFIEAIDLKHGSNDDGSPWAQAAIKWSITEPAVLEEMGREKVYLTQRMFLRLDPDTGKLSKKKGDNWEMGQVRAAVGKPTGPLNDIIGGNALIDVKHRVYEGKPQEDIRSVAAA
jgi:hypothetical protein